jgi:hypothetical protein
MDRVTTSVEGAESEVALWQTVVSVLAAFYGVQSSRAWQRDFSHGKRNAPRRRPQLDGERERSGALARIARLAAADHRQRLNVTRSPY